VDYWLDCDKSVLTLHFTLPLKTPLEVKDKTVDVDVYDPTFFVAFGFAKRAPVKIAGSPAAGCSAKIKHPDPETEEGAKALNEAFFN
jgi:ABC-type uncharacterized transport system substrate-binding protein